MTSIALLCYQLTGYGGQPEARAAARLMGNVPFSWDQPERWALYRWYYYTQVKFQQGGQAWHNWNSRFTPTVARHQNSDGSWTSPAAALGGAGSESPHGPAYATTLATLALQVYYRILPTYQVQEERPVMQDHKSDDINIEVI